jgi:hypothetical protein
MCEWDWRKQESTTENFDYGKSQFGGKIGCEIKTLKCNLL